MEAQTEIQRKPGRPRKIDSDPSSDKVQALIDIGIPIRMARFHQAILSFGNSADTNGTPEIALYSDANRKSRLAEMWYTPHCVVIKQRDIFKLIPLPQVADTIVL